MKKHVIGFLVIALVAIGALFAIGSFERRGLVDPHGHGEGCSHGDAHAQEGPHGGKVLNEGQFALEIVVNEQGKQPHFRLFPSFNNKAIDPSELKCTIEAERINGKVDTYHFDPNGKFLYSLEEISLPVSFFMKVTAIWKGESYEWEYSQYQGRFTLDEPLAQRMGIQTEIAAPSKIQTTIRLPGEVGFNMDKLSHIVPRVPGVITEVKKNLGDRVQKDEIIAIIESRELGESRSKYLVALERTKLAEYNFNRSERLHEKESVPEKEMLTAKKSYLEEKIELEAAGRKLLTMGIPQEEINRLSDNKFDNLTRFEIKAPLPGVVVKKHLTVGEWVKEDAEIYIIADMNTLWLNVTIYMNDLSAVFVGQKAIVQSQCGIPTTIGEVSYIEPTVGEDSRTTKARIILPNSEGKWRPGMFVQTDLVNQENDVEIAIRNDALQTYKDKTVVFIKHDDQYEMQPVVTGRKDGHFTEISKGLTSGDKYVVANAFVLKSELAKAGMSHQH